MKRVVSNPNCSHINCRKSEGEVRRLPLGSGGGILLCRDCFKHEIKTRKLFNREMGEKLWELPKWEELEIYELT